MSTTLYLTSTATASPFPTTSRTLVTSANASEVQLGPGEFDSGIPGTTDAGQWNPSSAVSDTTAAAEIDNTGSSPGTTRQGWLYDVDLTGKKLKAGAWAVQLRLRANQGTGTLGRIMMRVTIVRGSSGTWITDANLLTTSITGEASHSTGQNGWRANEGSRITVTSTAGNFAVTIESGATADEHTFTSGQRILVELGFGDGDSATDRTWRLDYNTSNSFVTAPDIVDPIAGTSDGTSTVSGALNGRGALAGSSAGTSTVDGTLTGEAAGAIAGSTAGTSTADATLVGRGALVGSEAGTSSTTAVLAGRGALAGPAAGTSTAAGSLMGWGELSGSAAGSSTATLEGPGPIDGSTAGTSTATATLTGRGYLAGSIAGTSTATATPVGGETTQAAILYDGGAWTAMLRAEGSYEGRLHDGAAVDGKEQN